jgi:hypothetical protein
MPNSVAKNRKIAQNEDRPLLAETVPGWPNQAEAAAILQVAESTLARARLPLARVSAGAKEKRLSPAAVLQAAVHFRRVPVRQVAGELLRLAERKSSQLVPQIEQEIEGALDRLTAEQTSTSGEFLARLEQLVPSQLYRQIAKLYYESAAGSDAISHVDTVSAGRATAPRRQRHSPA